MPPAGQTMVTHCQENETCQGSPHVDCTVIAGSRYILPVPVYMGVSRALETGYACI